MPVMSPGTGKTMTVWSPDSSLNSHYVVMLCVFFVLCAEGRPSPEVTKNKSYLENYSVTNTQPQYVQFGLFHSVPVSLYQPGPVYFSPGAGHVSPYYGGQQHLFQPAYYLPSYHYRGIEPVPQLSFQHVETQSLPAQLHSVQSYKYLAPQHASQQTIRPTLVQTMNTTIAPPRSNGRRRKPKAKGVRRLAMSRKAAAKKQNSIVLPAQEVMIPELDAEETALTPAQIDTSNAEHEQTDVEPESGESESSSISQKARIRQRRFLIILSSILTRNGGNLFPTPKLVRQASTTSTNDLYLNSDLPPIPVAEDESVEAEEMMEFGEPDGVSTSAAMAMKFGMNLVASTIPAPEPTSTPNIIRPDLERTTRNSVTVSTPVNSESTKSLNPSDVDYEVPDEGSEVEGLNDLPPLPSFTDDPVTPNSVLTTTTTENPLTTTDIPAVQNSTLPISSVSSDDSDSKISAEKLDEDYEGDFNDLPPLSEVDEEDNVNKGLNNTTSNTDSPISTPVSPSFSQETGEDNLSDLPSFVTMDDEEATSKRIIAGQEVQVQPKTDVPPERSTQGVVEQTRFEENNSDLPPLPGSLVQAEGYGEQSLPKNVIPAAPESNPSYFDEPLTDSFASDLPPLPDISLFPSTAEQDEPIRSPISSFPTQTTTSTTTTTESPTNIPIFSDDLPPFPVTEDGRLPELPFPSSLPEDSDEDQPGPEPYVVMSVPSRRTTERPVANARIPAARPRTTARPRISSVQPRTTTRPRFTSPAEIPVESEYIPAGNTDWIREVALKALDRGISFQQVYSINVGHVVINSGGSLSELQTASPKPFFQVIQEQVVPAISSLVGSQQQRVPTGPSNMRLVSTKVQQRPPTVRPVTAMVDTSIDAIEEEPVSDSEDSDLGTDFAPVPLATDADGDVGASEEELFSTRLNTTKASAKIMPSQKRPTPRPMTGSRPSSNKVTSIRNRYKVTELSQPELPTLVLPESGNTETSETTNTPKEISPSPKPFRPLPEDAPPPRVKLNIDPRSIDLDGFPFAFPEGSPISDQDSLLDFRSSLVKSMQNYKIRNTMTG